MEYLNEGWITKLCKWHCQWEVYYKFSMCFLKLDLGGTSEFSTDIKAINGHGASFSYVYHRAFLFKLIH